MSSAEGLEGIAPNQRNFHHLQISLFSSLTPYYGTELRIGAVEMTIGKLAKAAGVGVETIRFYERKGMIKRPSNRGGGFRQYPEDEVSRIRFIKRAQELGFTLREVKTLLDLQSKRKITIAVTFRLNVFIRIITNLQ